METRGVSYVELPIWVGMIANDDGKADILSRK